MVPSTYKNVVFFHYYAPVAEFSIKLGRKIMRSFAFRKAFAILKG